MIGAVVITPHVSSVIIWIFFFFVCFVFVACFFGGNKTVLVPFALSGGRKCCLWFSVLDENVKLSQKLQPEQQQIK